MSQWNPELYLRFEDERTRPAAELLARVPLKVAAEVVDLGCGPGNSTALLARRYAQASITGIDTSEAMLASARQRLPELNFVQADIAHWAPAQAPSLIYANAALQWVGNHDQLIPRLFAQLAPGGVLAIQMPDNLQEPTHRLMRELATQPPWRSQLADAADQRTRLPAAQHYYDLLAPQAGHLAHRVPASHGLGRGHRRMAARHRPAPVSRAPAGGPAGRVSGHIPGPGRRRLPGPQRRPPPACLSAPVHRCPAPPLTAP